MLKQTPHTRTASADDRDGERRSAEKTNRNGKVLVFTAIMLVPLFGFAALAVDATFLMEVKKEAENAAEAAALAGVMGLVHPDRMKFPPDMTQPLAQARTNAVTYAGKHNVGEVVNVLVDRNEANDFSGEVYIGRLRTWGYQDYPWEDDDPYRFNSVRVKVRRTAERNGPVGLFFANIFGVSSSPVEAVATARIEIGRLTGFNPGEGENTGLMPFAVCVTEWEEKINGVDPVADDGQDAILGPDEFRIETDADGNTVMNAEGNPNVVAGADGIREVLMYPQSHGGGPNSLPDIQACNANTQSQGGVQPGNFGTVDIGHSGNSTSDLIRQILYGVSQADLDYMAGQGVDVNLTPENPDFDLNGDTGISAGMKTALERIIGQCRTVLLYNWVKHNGNNAEFTIIRYQPIRIMEVKLTGFPKWVRIQPASACMDPAAVIDQDDPTGPQAFHPPRLIE